MNENERNENERNDDSEFNFFSDGPPDSLRDSGYKNTAYALGELVDNSIEADASEVEIIMIEDLVTANKQRRWKISEIGILDNGTGMDPYQLRCALKYQDGAAQRGWERSKGGGKKMGKFGVGLPQATLSVCRRVDVWSWQDGLESAVWTWFDLDNWQSMIPEPEEKEIPEKWLKRSSSLDNAGTLIVWSNLDRLDKTTSKGLYRNAEFLIGRMYRKHISGGISKIRMLALEGKEPWDRRYTDSDKDGVISEEEYHDWEIRANDPLYLDSSAYSGDPPVNPMFEQAGPSLEWSYMVTNPKTGETTKEIVKFTSSIAKKEAREGHKYVEGQSMQASGGSEPHGKHARKNMGVSIVREDRELELDDGWSQGKNVAYERWWGAEISFTSAMDHVFGVTNNKQSATILNDTAKKDWEYFRDYDDETTKEIQDRLKSESYEVWVCMDLKYKIWDLLQILRDRLEKTSIVKKESRKRRHKAAEKIASQKLTERREKGIKGKSSESMIEDVEARRLALRKQLRDEAMDEDLAEHLEDLIITQGYDVVFSEKKIDGDAFFSVETKQGALILFMNENHAAFKHLFTVLDKIDTDNESNAEKLRERVNHASAALKLILASWAIYEDEAREDELRSLLRARRTWGRYADDVLPRNNDEYEEEI